MTDWPLPAIDDQACTRCGLCVQYCPTHAVEMNATWPVIARPQDCTYCGNCEEMCPEGAISLVYEFVVSCSDQHVSPQEGSHEGERDT